PGGVVRLLGLEVTSVGAGLPLIALGVILVAVAAVLREREGDPVRSAGCRLRITAPKDGEKITNRGITVIQGTACSSDTIWLFDYSINDQDYYWENEEPLDVIGGQWSHNDERIGAFDNPVGTKYLLVAVRVGRECNRALRGRPRSHGGVGLSDANLVNITRSGGAGWRLGGWWLAMSCGRLSNR
ncbi:MAG: hypothetical protein LC808_08335, partial [Actinobacteria bacterium]|nr:hypothetical protein [Actinomycetota bacterium]